MKYHGWIVREEQGKGFNPIFYAELISTDPKDNGERIRPFKSYSPAAVVDWWDKKVGKPVKLIDTPLQAYRVYTED